MLRIDRDPGPGLGRSDLVIVLECGPDAEAAVVALTGLLSTEVLAHGSRADGGDVRAVAVLGPSAVLDRVAQLIAELPGPEIWGVPASRPGEGLEPLAAVMAPADLVLLGSGARLAPGSIQALSRAARSDAVIATASALDAVVVDDRDEPGLVGAGNPIEPGGLPRLGAPAGPCVFVRRSAIELVAGFGASEFAARCQDRGMAHVLAGAIVVAGAPVLGLGRRPGEPGGAVPGAVPAGPRLRARLARGELAVVIDARRLSGALDGTRVHVCELIGAVAGTGAAEVTVLLPEQLAPDTRRLLNGVDGVREVIVDAAGQPPVDLRADVVHRPHQVHAPADLTLLAQLAPRLVLTQQDLIGFHARDYYASLEGWQGYRELTRLALASADRVLFFSAHTRAEALAEELVEPARAEVIPIGTDHSLRSEGGAARAPSQVQGLAPEAEVILCLGTDMRHKNREFALALLARLRRAHAWQGSLIFAGPHVSLGASSAAEAALLGAAPDLAAAVLELGEVSDAERDWLLRRATVVLYPTVHEGFGLVPYEAAAHGVPCLWAPGTSLTEMLGDTAAGIVPWDVVAGADRALALMRDPAERAANVAAVTNAGQKLSWAQTGQALIEAYRAACTGPPSPAGAIARSSGLMNGQVSSDGIRLVGPDGLLPADAERPLLAVLSRPRLAAPVLGALRQGYRLARRRADSQ